MALLDRAKADLGKIEQVPASPTNLPPVLPPSHTTYLCYRTQLEKDHTRMARLFQKGMLPSGLWEQLTEAEALMDGEMHQVRAEAERLQKGWSKVRFSSHSCRRCDPP